MPGRALRPGSGEVSGRPPIPRGVESPQCPEGHYDQEAEKFPAGLRSHEGLNPLNARKGITTYFHFCCYQSSAYSSSVESPQCPEGHYDAVHLDGGEPDVYLVESPQCPEGHYDEFSRRGNLLLQEDPPG